MTELKRKDQEIAHGRHIAHQAAHVWQRDTAAGRRRVEIRFERFRPWFSDRRRVLELGCGTGEWTAYLARLDLDLTATEISPDLLDIARRKHPRVRFVEGDCEALPFEPHTFDGICGLSILHHLNLLPALKEMNRLLKPGGKIWFSEPNMLNPQIFIQKNVPFIKRLAGDTPNETAFFRWRMHRLLRAHGFVQIRVIPIDFLHPQTPELALSRMEWLSQRLERVPVIREIAGSLEIAAQKPI